MEAETLADYIVKKCVKDNYLITSTDIQSILYFIQIAYLHKKGFPAFNDDFCTWHSGPVIPSVYYRYQSFGIGPVSYSYGRSEDGISDSGKAFIDPVIEEVRQMRPWDIEKDVKREGGAWQKSRDVCCSVNKDMNIISKKMIKAEHSKILDDIEKSLSLKIDKETA